MPARGPAVVLGLRQLARSALVQGSLDTRDHHARPRRVEARPSRRPVDARRLAIIGGHPAWRISRADPQDPRAWQPAAAARAPAAHTAARAPPPHTTHQRSSGARCPGRRAAHASGGGGLRAEPHQAGGSRGTSRSAGCWARMALAAARGPARGLRSASCHKDEAARACRSAWWRTELAGRERRPDPGPKP